MTQDQFAIVGAGLRESSSLLFRLREKIYDKYFWSKEDMQDVENSFDFLKIAVKNDLPDTFKPYFEGTFSPQNIKKFKRGFHTKSVTFETTSGNATKKWVLKIGHRISPIVDLGDPSDYSYFLEYTKDMEILEKYCKRHEALHYFIPKPQHCFWTGEKNKPGKTLILQPFLRVAPLEKTIKKLDSLEKKRLKQELTTIKELQKTLTQKYKKQFDFLGEDNIVLMKQDNQYHFVLLDTGLINLTKPLPLTQLVMQISYDMLTTRLENLLK